MRAVFAAACLLLAGVAGTPEPSPTPISSASPTPASSANPSPAPTPTILMLAPDAPPQILWVGMSSTAPRAGDALTVTVLTSSNVASVELRVGGYGAGMTKTDIGHFESTTQVPRLPLFVSHNILLAIIARNTGGASAVRNIELQLR
jgi:hypothetical protein